MDVCYSIAAKLGSGIGYTAENAINAIKEKGWLKQLFTLKEIPIEEGQWKDYAFDNIASIKLDTMNIFHGWCNMSYSQILKAHSFGAKTVIERASSHVLDQYRVMVEEYERFKIKSGPIHPYSIRKQLNEYEMSDYVATPSEYSKQSLLNHSISEEKILQLPYGVDTDKFTPIKVEKDNIFRVLFVGQNWIRKGLYYLEKAFSELDIKDAKLIVRCDAPIFPDIDYKNIIRKEWVDDIVELYNSIDIFCLPTLEEGNALVVGELASCSVPSITTYNSGTWLEDGKSCFFVPIRDINALKEKLRYCYDNPDVVKKFGREARKKAEKNTWDNYGKRLLDNYEKIIA